MKAFIVKDDTGVLATVDVADYDSITEAHIGAVEELIDWFESDDAVEVYDMEHNEDCVRELERRKDDIRNFAIDETEIIEVSGFEIEYKES